MRAPGLKRLLPSGRQLVVGVPFFWLLLFFLLPFVIVLKISFAEADVAIPPYTEVFAWAENQLQVLLNFGNYVFLSEDETGRASCRERGTRSAAHSRPQGRIAAPES